MNIFKRKITTPLAILFLILSLMSCPTNNSDETYDKTILVSVDSIDFGASETSKTFTIENTGIGNLVYNINISEEWLECSAQNGSVEDEEDIITVTINRENLDAGEYYSTISIESDGGDASITVTMTVSNTTTVSGYAFFAGTTIPVSGVTISVSESEYTTSSNGYYELENIGIGEQTLYATKSGFDNYSRNLNIPEAGITHNVEMTGNEVYSLSGYVRDVLSNPLDNVIVTILNPDNSESVLVDTTDSNGHYQIPSVPQGNRNVSYNKTTYYDTEELIYIYNSDKNYDVVLDSIQLNAPNNVVTDKSGGVIIIDWEDSNQNENGYIIERKEGKTGSYSEIGNVNSNTTSFSDPDSNNLSPLGYYFYRIKSYNIYEESVYSNEKYAVANPDLIRDIQDTTVKTLEKQLELRLDSSGQDKIAFMANYSSTSTMIATWTGSSWQLDDVDIGWNNDIVFDIDGSSVPYLSWCEINPYTINFTYFDSSSWQIVSNEQDYSSNELYLDMYISNDNTINFAQQMSFADGRSLFYTKWDGTTWSTEIADNGAHVGYYPSIKIDSTGNVHIMHYDIFSSATCLKYTHNESGSWNTDIIDNSADVGKYNSLCLDSNDNPHVSYVDSSSKLLKYAFFDGSNWVIETVDSDNVAGFTALCLDDSGIPYIVYIANNNPGDIRFAYKEQDEWVLVTLVEGANVCPDIAIDSTNYVHIAYLNKYGDLFFGKFRP